MVTMERDVADIYKRAVEDLAVSQNRDVPICPFDGFSCCNICVDCGEPFCESGVPNACERMSGLGCSGIRGEGCPKGWSMKRNE